MANRYTFKMACWDTTPDKKITNSVNLTLINKSEEEAIKEAKRVCKRMTYTITDISQVI